ncbi:unnamed protein product, partial [Prorocentrum cordatum]
GGKASKGARGKGGKGKGVHKSGKGATDKGKPSKVKATDHSGDVEGDIAKNMQIIIQCRELCEVHGHYKVGISSRPKKANGGWEVHIQNKGPQKWSRLSSATDSSLKET